MNIKAIIEFLMGVAVGELPVYVQPVAWLAIIVGAILFFVMILKVLFIPFNYWGK